MTPREWFAATTTGIMATTAMLGSISGLVAFANQGRAGEITIPLNGGFTLPLGTLAFVACVDGLAIAMTVQVHDHDRGIDPWPLAVLVAVTAFSAVLQCIATPDPLPGFEADAWKIRVAHTVPAPFAAVAAAMFFRLIGVARRRAEAEAAERAEAERAAAEAEERKAARRSRVTSPPPPPAAPEVTSDQVAPAAAEVTPGSPESPAASPEGDDLEGIAAAAGRSLGITRESTDTDLAEVTSQVAQDVGVTLADLGVPRVRRICKAAGCGVGAPRAKTVLALARDTAEDTPPPVRLTAVP